MNLIEYYTHFRNACLHHKDINTFCVLKDPSDLTKENLNRNITDKSKPYFLSKEWVENGYDANNITFKLPGLFLYEMPFKLRGMFSGKEKYEYEIQAMLLVDNYDYRVSSDSFSDEMHQINQQQISIAKYLLLDVFNYMNSFTRFQKDNLEVEHEIFLTNTEKAVGVSAKVTLIESCPISLPYWQNQGRYIIDNDGTVIIDNDGSIVSYPENN